MVEAHLALPASDIVELVVLAHAAAPAAIEDAAVADQEGESVEPVPAAVPAGAETAGDSNEIRSASCQLIPTVVR